MSINNEAFPIPENLPTIFDVCLVGGGLHALALGCQIAANEPQKSICIINEGFTNYDGCSKNPGFATGFSLSRFFDDCRRIGIKRALGGVRDQLRALKLLFTQVDGNAEVIKLTGSYEIFTAKNAHLLDALEQANKALFELLGENAFEIRNEKIEEFGLNRQLVRALVFNRLDWQVNMGKALTVLARKFQRMGGRIITGCKTVSYKESIETYGQTPAKDLLSARSDYRIELGVVNQAVGDCIEPIYCEVAIFCSAIPPALGLKQNQKFARASEVLVTRPVAELSFQTNLVIKEFSCSIRTISQRILIERLIEAKDMTQTSRVMALSPDNETLLKILHTVLPTYNFEPDCSWHYLNYSVSDRATNALLQLSKHAFYFAEDCQNGLCMNFLFAEKAYRRLFRLRAKL